MMTVDEQKRIISIACTDKDRSIQAIRNSDYAKEVKNPDYGQLIIGDLQDYVTIIETGLPQVYFNLDTLARDHFIGIMQTEYAKEIKEA